MSLNKIKLRVLTPERNVVSEMVDKVVAEAQNGSFGLKPRHVDYLAELVPGIFTYWMGTEEFFLAVDGGILVKKADKVTVSVSHAVVGDDLLELEDVVGQQFKILDQREHDTQIALEQLQADFIKQFVELQKQ